MAEPHPLPRLIVCPGARAAEARLFTELDRLLDEAEAEPARLARPVRVVVPSTSLRRHLGAALTRHRGRSILGVTVQTHFTLALEILERAGETARPGGALFELLPQRAARREAALRQPLEDLVDGYGAVVGTVRDLLDAGFEPALAQGLDEVLAAEGRRLATTEELDRARALLRVASATFEALEAGDVGHPSRLLRRATELLELSGDTLLPARAVLVHGFADATGTVTDLIQALQRRLGARVVLDRPPDPAGGEGGTFGGRFGERFLERMTLAAGPEVVVASPAAAGIERFTAHGAEGEVREVARRLQALLADGARPEGLAVVARDLAPYRQALRRHFERLGIPFSGLGEPGALTPTGRRLRALLDLLGRRERTPTERWLDALEALPGDAPMPASPELRLALAALGAGRLAEVARVPVDGVLRHGRFPLPIRQGLVGRAPEPDLEDGSEPEGEEAAVGGGALHAGRRTLDGALLRQAVAAAETLRRHLAGWPPTATLEDHLERLGSLLADHLGWGRSEAVQSRRQGPEDPLQRAVEALAAEAPPAFELSFAELRAVLARSLEDRGTDPLGGAGGGVQMLSVTEARGRSFDHLFVLGLHRGAFPRPIREDPLLADDLRSTLRTLLPDLPVKAAGFEEERHLFAHLLSASPRVTLSWQSFDETGAPRSPSPLLERLPGGAEGAPEAPPIWSPTPSALPRPAAEAATLAALHGGRERFRHLLPLAVAEARETLPEPRPLAPAALAAARLAVLDELDPERGPAVRLGPYFGFVGTLTSPQDPRHGPLYVTTLERLAGCPWQVFLTRLLRLEPTPDPLMALPALDPLLLGTVVHRVLDRIGRQGPLGDPPPTLSGLPATPAATTPWPEEAELMALLEAEAGAVLTEEGIPLAGLRRALVRLAHPYLVAAREVDWPASGDPAVLGTEVEGSLAVRAAADRQRELRFRADRVDRSDDGLRLTDYKTGRPLSRGGKEPKTEAKRREILLAEVAAGTRLQAAAYALAAEGAEGRYLFLHPQAEHRVYGIRGADGDLADAFRRAAAVMVDAWEAGTFVPRLVDPEGREEPSRCSWCPVAEACLRGDSGARLRLVEWSRRERGAGAEGSSAEEAALRGVWGLAARRGEPADGEVDR